MQPTSLIEVADALRRRSVLIETPDLISDKSIMVKLKLGDDYKADVWSIISPFAIAVWGEGL